MSFAFAVAIAGIGLKWILDFEYIPNLVSVESVKSKHFDYIIIGAGNNSNLNAVRAEFK